MTNRIAIRIAAILGMCAVALGAFGAHGLKTVLEENGTADIWEKAVFYHFIHTVMLVIVSLREPLLKWAWITWFCGILIFSGSLYVLAVTNLTKLGAITPIGGVSLIAGWVLLLISASQSKPGTGR